MVNLPPDIRLRCHSGFPLKHSFKKKIQNNLFFFQGVCFPGQLFLGTWQSGCFWSLVVHVFITVRTLSIRTIDSYFIDCKLKNWIKKTKNFYTPLKQLF